jgi:hypothetical protein
MKVYNGQEDKINRKRTTSKLVLQRIKQLVTDQRVQKSDFRYLGSHFYEWGLTL